MDERKYLIVIETSPGKNPGAYVPDLPGCVATGDTVEAVKRNICEAIKMHIEGMIEDGDPIPEASSIGGDVVVQLGPQDRVQCRVASN